MAKSSRTDRNASQINQRDGSVSRNSNRYGSLSPGPRRNNNFSFSKNLMNLTSGTPHETSTTRGITLKFASKIIPKTTKEAEVLLCSIEMKKNANILTEPTIPAVSAKQVSVVAKLASSGTNARPDGKT